MIRISQSDWNKVFGKKTTKKKKAKAKKATKKKAKKKIAKKKATPARKKSTTKKKPARKKSARVTRATKKKVAKKTQARKTRAVGGSAKKGPGLSARKTSGEHWAKKVRSGGQSWDMCKNLAALKAAAPSVPSVNNKLQIHRVFRGDYYVRNSVTSSEAAGMPQATAFGVEFTWHGPGGAVRDVGYINVLGNLPNKAAATRTLVAATGVTS